jgi:hypothetical protein
MAEPLATKSVDDGIFAGRSDWFLRSADRGSGNIAAVGREA